MSGPAPDCPFRNEGTDKIIIAAKVLIIFINAHLSANEHYYGRRVVLPVIPERIK
jgi:hypothetical protein